MDRAWTREDVREANALSAAQWEEWHVQQNQHGPWRDVRHLSDVPFLPWLWIIYVQRLCWTYGEEGALIRLNEGRREAA